MPTKKPATKQSKDLSSSSKKADASHSSAAGPGEDQVEMKVLRCRLPFVRYECGDPPEGEALCNWVQDLMEKDGDGVIVSWAAAEVLSADCLALTAPASKPLQDVLLHQNLRVFFVTVSKQQLGRSGLQHHMIIS